MGFLGEITPAALDLPGFGQALADVGHTLTTVVLPGMAGVAVAGLGVSLAVGWIRRIRSAV